MDEFRVEAILSIPEPVDEVDRRLCEIAIELFARYGVRRTSIEDIARKGRINPSTLYRRLGTKDQIIQAAIGYEARRLFREIDGRISSAEGDFADRFVEGFAILVELVRGHPLFDQVLEDEQEEIGKAVGRGAGPILQIASHFLAEKLRHAWNNSDVVPSRDPVVSSAIVVRLVHSLLIIPDAEPQMATRDDVRNFASEYLLPLVMPTEIAHLGRVRP